MGEVGVLFDEAMVRLQSLAPLVFWKGLSPSQALAGLAVCVDPAGCWGLTMRGSWPVLMHNPGILLCPHSGTAWNGVTDVSRMLNLQSIQRRVL